MLDATLTRNTAFSVMKNRIRVNQLNIGWMASDHERELQAAERGDPDWEAKAIVELPFGRLIDPVEAARAVNFMVSDDAGFMTGVRGRIVQRSPPARNGSVTGPAFTGLNAFRNGRALRRRTRLAGSAGRQRVENAQARLRPRPR